MPGERYFGNTLTDLQAALTARDRLAAEQNIASQGNMVRFTQGMQQAGAQRAALQQQAMQQGEQNRLAQQQMAQADYFNRGRLQNEEARIAAELEAVKAQADAAGKRFTREDETRRFLGELMAGSRSGSTGLAADQAELMDASTNYANLKNMLEDLTAQESQVGTAETLAKESPSKLKTAGSMIGPFGVGGGMAYRYFANKGIENRARAELPYQHPADPALPLSTDITLARQSVAAKKAELSSAENAMRQAGLDQHVAKVDGKWVSTFRPPMTAPNPIFGNGAPSTQAVTNGAPYFNPEATNAPSVEGPIPAPMNPAQRQVGVVYQTPRGPLRWTAAGWMPL